MSSKTIKGRTPFTCNCKVPKKPAPGYKDVILDLLQIETLEKGQIIRSNVKYGVNLASLLGGELTRGVSHRFDEESCITSEFTPILIVMHVDGRNISVYGKAKVGGRKLEWVEVVIPKSNGLAHITFCIHKERSDDALVVARTPVKLR